MIGKVVGEVIDPYSVKPGMSELHVSSQQKKTPEIQEYRSRVLPVLGT